MVQQSEVDENKEKLFTKLFSSARGHALVTTHPYASLKTLFRKPSGKNRMEKRAHTSHRSTHMKLSTSLANVTFGLHLTMKSFFCSVVSFTILANKDLPHFVLASSSRIHFLYVVAEVEKVGSSFTRFGQDG
jgi:hypothetical protein